MTMVESTRTEKVIGYSIESDYGNPDARNWREWEIIYGDNEEQYAIQRMSTIRGMNQDRSYRLVRVTAVREVIDE